jgi:hypothetical protein
MEPTFGLVLTIFGFEQRTPMVALGQARQGFRLLDSLRPARPVSRTGRGNFMSWLLLLVVSAPTGLSNHPLRVQDAASVRDQGKTISSPQPKRSPAAKKGLDLRDRITEGIVTRTGGDARQS